MWEKSLRNKFKFYLKATKRNVCVTRGIHSFTEHSSFLSRTKTHLCINEQWPINKIQTPIQWTSDGEIKNCKKGLVQNVTWLKERTVNGTLVNLIALMWMSLLIFNRYTELLTCLKLNWNFFFYFKRILTKFFIQFSLINFVYFPIKPSI